ncbi:MAG: hypothetical protein RR338_03650 [Clostridia bacterium]
MQQEKTIYTQGVPSISKLPKDTAKVFYATLLSRVIEYYRPATEAEKATQSVAETKMEVQNGLSKR